MKHVSDGHATMCALVGALEFLLHLPSGIGHAIVASEGRVRGLMAEEGKNPQEKEIKPTEEFDEEKNLDLVEDSDSNNLVPPLYRLRNVLDTAAAGISASMTTDRITTASAVLGGGIDDCVRVHVAKALAEDETLSSKREEKASRAADQRCSVEKAWQQALFTKKQSRDKKLREKREKQLRTDADVLANQDRLMGRFGVTKSKFGSQAKQG